MIRSPRFTEKVSSTWSEPFATVVRTAVTVRAIPTQFLAWSRSPRSPLAVTATKMGEVAPRTPALSAEVWRRPRYQRVVLPTRPVRPRTMKAR